MKRIVKNPVPLAFENWKMQERPTNWGNLPSKSMPEARQEAGIHYYSKEELRQALLQEQGFICCYCMQRISNAPTTKIEHLEPREGDSETERIFDYHNLLVSCNGGEKDPKPKTLHCDTFKGNKSIALTPLQPACEQAITFTTNGQIIARSPAATTTIKNLNLAIPKLNNQRSAAIAGFIYEDSAQTELIDPKTAKQLAIQLKKRNPQYQFTPFVKAILDALDTLY